MLDQLSKMANELINANASMASELGPLAQQKAGDIIDEGSEILRAGDFSKANEDDYEKINAKLAQLRHQLHIVEELVRDRIKIAKLQNSKLQNQVNFFNQYLLFNANNKKVYKVFLFS